LIQLLLSPALIYDAYVKFKVKYKTSWHQPLVSKFFQKYIAYRTNIIEKDKNQAEVHYIFGYAS
jgi:hypothetical protein